jgi:hypothetical protein
LVERLRDWFERQVQARPDGYLVRPLGRVAGVYALRDEAAKDRYIARRSAIACVDAIGRALGVLLAMLFVTVLFFDGGRLFDLLPEAVLIGLIVAPIALHLIISALLHWHVFRHVRRSARRVSEERWSGAPPRETVPLRVLPAWVVAVSFTSMLALSGCFAAFLANAFSHVLPRAAAGDVGAVATVVVSLVAILTIWAVIALDVRDWWRANRRPTPGA